MSDLVGNHIVGFPTRRLVCEAFSLVVIQNIVFYQTSISHLYSRTSSVVIVSVVSSNSRPTTCRCSPRHRRAEKGEVKLYYPCSENKGADQQCSFCWFLARLHEVHRAIVVTSVVRVYVYVRVTLSVKVF